MIQELLGGGAALIGGERKISIPGCLEPSSSSTPSPSPSSSTATTNAASSENQNQNQNLRCPRCDSTNTKFCYYNNYNLTQPRHFCKTCRRYWTKGGALRNVPIGGGCRKNKNITVTASAGAAVKSNAAKLKTSMSCEIGKLGFEGYNHELPPNPMLWGPPQSSHLLALLRSNQNPNLIGNPNSVSVKEESVMAGGLSAQTLGLGQFNQIPSVGLCNPFWRSNQSQGQQGGFVLGEVQNYTEIQDLYQRLRSTGNYYPDRHHSSSVMMSNAASSSCCSSILESAPVAAVSGDLGYWNATPSWSDLPTANGAYP